MNAKPKLKPVYVPWMISPSNPLLLLQGDGKAVTFAAYFKLDDENSGITSDLSFPAILKEETVFCADVSDERAAYKMVRITFEEAEHFRIMPAKSDIEVITEEAFDWSLVGVKRSDEKISEFLRRYDETWTKTGACPNPRMYEVLESPWVVEHKSVNALPWHHYLMLGHDYYVEGLARAWRWEPGQPLWQGSR